MGEPGAALKTPGSREVNLPAGVSPVAGGCEMSDCSQHDGSPRKRGDADSPPSSEVLGEGGESVKEDQPKKGVVWVRYTENGKEPVVMKLSGDPFEVIEQVRARMFPGVKVLPVDEKFYRIMRAREQRTDQR